LWTVFVEILEGIGLILAFIVALVLVYVVPAFVIYVMTLYVIVRRRERKGDAVRDAPTSRLGRMNDWTVRKIFPKLPWSKREPPITSSPSDSRMPPRPAITKTSRHPRAS
jgi:hypothetical protein